MTKNSNKNAKFLQKSNSSQVCYVRMCGFQECDQIATLLAGFSCAACVTNTSAAVTSEFLPYLLYSVGMHAWRFSLLRNYKARDSMWPHQSQEECSVSGNFLSKFFIVPCLSSIEAITIWCYNTIQSNIGQYFKVYIYNIHSLNTIIQSITNWRINKYSC